jgi:hypothetical protein
VASPYLFFRGLSDTNVGSLWQGRACAACQWRYLVCGWLWVVVGTGITYLACVLHGTCTCTPSYAIPQSIRHLPLPSVSTRARPFIWACLSSTAVFFLLRGRQRCGLPVAAEKQADRLAQAKCGCRLLTGVVGCWVLRQVKHLCALLTHRHWVGERGALFPTLPCCGTPPSPSVHAHHGATCAKGLFFFWRGQHCTVVQGLRGQRGGGFLAM